LEKPNPDGDLFKNQNQTLTYNVGLINNFQVSKSVALFLEIRVEAISRNVLMEVV